MKPAPSLGYYAEEGTFQRVQREKSNEDPTGKEEKRGPEVFTQSIEKSQGQNPAV